MVDASVMSTLVGGEYLPDGVCDCREGGDCLFGLLPEGGVDADLMVGCGFGLDRPRSLRHVG